MEIERALGFVRANHHAILATRRADGRPQLSPVVVVADDDGHLLVSTRETSVKAVNLGRDPHVSLCVIDDAFFGDWVQVDGVATVVALPEAMDGLVDYYRRAVGEHPDWDDYRVAMERERRVLVRIRVERAGPDRSG
jgi:PPOX class probable F420-dependent enzyme